MNVSDRVQVDMQGQVQDFERFYLHQTKYKEKKQKKTNKEKKFFSSSYVYSFSISVINWKLSLKK